MESKQEESHLKNIEINKKKLMIQLFFTNDIYNSVGNTTFN
jgi:hypothetical protein